MTYAVTAYVLWLLLITTKYVILITYKVLRWILAVMLGLILSLIRYFES